MALDPRVLAALTAGARTTADYEPLVYGGGQEKQGAWNLGQSVIDVLSTGGYATAGLTNKIGQNIAAIGRGEIGAAADLINPASGLSAMVKGVSDRRTYSQNLQEMGVDRNASVWLGLALDIGLDPTTYITGGALAGVKGAAQGARIAGAATQAGKVAAERATTTPLAGGIISGTRLAGATKATDAFVPVNRPLTDQEKIGNLLTGISKGYQTGKNQYKLTIKNNRLNRIQKRQAKKLDEIRGEVTIGDLYAKAPAAADVVSVVEKMTAKEQKAAAAVAKAKSKVDASALPGVTAGTRKAAATRLATETLRVVGIAEEVDGGFKAVVKSPEGEVLNHSFENKTYKTEANARKAAEKAAAEVEAKLLGGAEIDARQSTAAPTANDEAVNAANRPVEADADSVRIRSELAEGGRKNRLLNELAQSIARPGRFLKPRKLDENLRAEFDAAKEDFLLRFDEFKEAETGSLAFSPAKIEATTLDDLNKYASARSPEPNALFDALLEARATVPNTFRSLLAAMQNARIAPSDATIGDLAFLASEDVSAETLEQIRKAFIISKEAFEEGIATNPTLKPWIDGIVTPNDAEDAIRSLMDFIYDGLKPDSAAYRAIVKTISDAFAGRLKAVSGGMDQPLKADEVEEVFEAFFAGVNIPKILDKVGNVDLAKMRDETYGDIAEFAEDLQSGKLKLSETAKRDLANILGVPPSIVAATLKTVTESVNGLGRALDPDADAALIRSSVTPADAATATGNMTGAGAAEVAVPALALDAIDEVVAQAADIAAPLPEALVPAASRSAVITQRERYAQDFVTDIAEYRKIFDTGTDRQAIARVIRIFKGFLMPQVVKQIAALAKKREISVDDALKEILDGDLRVISEDPNALTFGGALKLDELGTHGKIDIYNYLVKGTSLKFYKNQASAKMMLQREAFTISPVENLYRSLGVPVRSTESAAAAARREGVKPGSKAAKKIKRLYSSVGYSDIAKEMLRQNKINLGWELRKVRGEPNQGYKLGNFTPTSIEAAWLTVKRYKETGADFSKGTENYDELVFLIDNAEQTVDGATGGFGKAPHAKYAEISPAAAKTIEKTRDDLIKFLDDNYDTFKALDDSREGNLLAENGQAIFQDAARVLASVIRFSSEYATLKQNFKAGEITGTQLTDSFSSLVSKHDELINRLGTGEFSDRNLAQNMASVYKSAIIDAYTRNGEASVTFPSLVNELTNALAEIRAVDTAMASAKAAGKSVANQERAGKSARTTQMAKSQEQEVEIANEQLSRSSAAGAPTPTATEGMDIAAMEPMSINGMFAKKDTRWTKTLQAIDGEYGMGPEGKTIIAAAELKAISNAHRFSIRLKGIARATKGREAEVTTAFKAVQAFRRELDAAAELGDIAPTADEFLAQFGTVDREIFDALSKSMEELVGTKNIFGMVRTLGVMKSELNEALRQFGLAGIRVGDNQTLDNFWLGYDPDKFPDRNAFEFINLLNLSVHRAAARVEIASRFNTFVGSTPAEIKAAGESIADYVKIDTDTGIGELLGETNKLVHKDEFERLKYVQAYLNYDTEFSESALRRIIDVTDKATYVLKSTNTLLRVGHHVTTIIGEAAMNALAGVRLSSYNNTARILNRFRPGQYENAGEPFKAYADLNAAKGKTVKASEFDNVYWIRPDGRREIIPDEILYDLAERNGVLVHPGGSLEDFITTADGVMKGAYAGFQTGMNKIAVFASHRDNFFRLTHFIDELQRTQGAKSIEEAALSAGTVVRQWHPTAGSLSGFEKKYLRRSVYFYTWQRVALVKVIETMLTKPGIVTIPSKIQYAIADANGMNPESFGDPWDPDGMYASWYTGQMWGPQFQGPAGEGDSWGIQPAIQPIDVVGQVFKPFTIQPGQDPLTSMAQGAGDLMAANLNPIVKTLIESSAQSRLGTGGDLPGAPEYLLNQIGVISTLSKVTGIGQDPNPYETPQEREENNARLITNLMLGQRLTDYSTPASQYKWTVDQQEIMRRMAE